VPEPTGAPFADRTEPDEASIAEQKLQGRQAAGADRGNTAPIHGAKIGGRGRAQDQLAYGRKDAVGSNNKVVLAQQSGRCRVGFDQDGLDPPINSSVLPG
jgi:hypothetical protein